jgi:aryl-alcohol dehydrogenase-like predicted oxidoreductase
MQLRPLGRNGPMVSQVGLGCMGMSGAYGPSDEKESLATIDAALEVGITMFDSGDFYGMGHNEMLLGRALQGRRDKVFLALKFGAQRGPDGAWLGFDARPAAVKTSLAYSLKRLGTDYVDLYQPARVDPSVPIEDTVGAIADLIKAGFVRHVGLSEASAGTLVRAHRTHPIAALQIEYSLVTRHIEENILPTAHELGVAITAYGVLSRGLLGGHHAADKTLHPSDFRAHTPRFQGMNLERNLQLVEALRDMAAKHGATPAQVATAWVISRGADIFPLVGARHPKRLAESLAALSLRLSPTDLKEIESVVHPGLIQGERYPRPQMASLDSEQRPS